MQRSWMSVAVMAAVIGTGCAQRVVSESGGDVAMGSASMGESWGGSFRGSDGWSSTRGSVFARPVEGGTSIALTVEGGLPGSRYGWEVREGRCGTEGTLIGAANAYTPVLLGDRGVGSSVTDVPVRLDPAKEYSVHLFGTTADRSLPIGCGALTR